MRTNSQIIRIGLSVFCLLVSACSAERTPTAIPTLPSPSSTPTETFTPAPTSTPTIPPTPTSTPIGGMNSLIIYEDVQGLKVAMPESNQGGVLISHSELQSILPKDRYLESVAGESWGYERNRLMMLSPDGKSLLTDVCASLNDRRMCMLQYFVVSLDLSSITQLTVPGASSVFWQWSPDGRKLAGLASAFGKYPFEEPVAYYVINSDGTGLTRIGAVPLNTYNMAWSSDGQTVYPLSLATHFRAMPADGSGERAIEIDDLEADDQITCLQFSPDHEKVGLMVTRAFPKGHYRIYTADPDFTNSILTAEFDSEHSSCAKFDWSPTQDYILVGFYGKSVGNGFIVDYLNLVFEVKTGNAVNLPSRSDSNDYFEDQVCGWTPDGSLIYRGNSIELLDLSDPGKSTPIDMKDCPILWLPQQLLSADLADTVTSLQPLICTPGVSFKGEADDSLPAYIDLLEVRTELEGRNLTAVFTLRDIADDIDIQLSPTMTGQPQALWSVFIDVDRRADTGDVEGYEASMDIANLLRGGEEGSEYPQTLNLSASRGEYDPSDKESMFVYDTRNFSIDKQTNTITISAYIKGITPDSSIMFRTYANTGGDSYNAFDSLCR